MAKLNVKSLLIGGILLPTLCTWWWLSAEGTGLSAKPAEPASQAATQSPLASTAQRGQAVSPDYVLAFPADHGAHPLFDIEWWYLTANLSDEQGQEYGLQWTLFRFRSPRQMHHVLPWANDQLYMAHASVHSLDSHWFAEKFARGEVGNSGITTQPLQLYIDDWQWLNSATTESEQTDLLPANLAFSAPLLSTHKGNDYDRVQATLQLQARGPIVLQGEQGYSLKSRDAAYASYYYSQPFISILGQLSFLANNDQVKETREVKGLAWFDHEWTSQLVDQRTLGWDWLSLHLHDGSKIMAFSMRITGQADFVTGSYISADGQQKSLSHTELKLQATAWTDVEQRQLPLSWQLNIPKYNIDIQITSRKKNQWNPALVPYYEGMVEVSGSHQGKGFLELTGY
jgi:predicted secreted hydrolase